MGISRPEGNEMLPLKLFLITAVILKPEKKCVLRDSRCHSFPFTIIAFGVRTP